MSERASRPQQPDVDRTIVLDESTEQDGGGAWIALNAGGSVREALRAAMRPLEGYRPRARGWVNRWR